jgi:hypothetical protein
LSIVRAEQRPVHFRPTVTEIGLHRQPRRIGIAPLDRVDDVQVVIERRPLMLSLG